MGPPGHHRPRPEDRHRPRLPLAEDALPVARHRRRLQGLLRLDRSRSRRQGQHRGRRQDHRPPRLPARPGRARTAPTTVRPTTTRTTPTSSPRSSIATAAVSTVGRSHAIEVWNEVNLDREWGNATINQQQAADYVRLLSGAYYRRASRRPGSHGHHRRPVAHGRHGRPLRGRRPVPAVAVRRGPARATTTCSARTATPRRPKSTSRFGSLPRLPAPQLLLPPHRAAARRHGQKRRRRQARLAAGVRLDGRHTSTPTTAWFAVSEDKKGSQHPQGVPVRARSTGSRGSAS